MDCALAPMTTTQDHPYRSLLIRLTVLLGGAVGMVLELVGSRLLAPYFGNGLFVWTALIGIMLGFMSLGNYLGGRWADRHLSVSVLFWILLGSAAGIALVAFVEPLILPWLAATGSIKVAAVGGAIALFAVPCTMLGMVTPYSTRYAIHSLADSGVAVGSIFALGTLGSIIGTFLGGFYLIAWVGSHDLIAYLALVPLVLSLVYLTRPIAPKVALAWVAIAVMVGLAMVSSAGALESIDTGYDRYFVYDSVDQSSGRPVRFLARDFESAESAVYTDTGEAFMFNYFQYYDLTLGAANTTGAPLAKTLLIGGGIFSYPRHQVAEYPDSTCDAVEIDPDLYDLARERFMLGADDRVRIHIEDGRTYLNRVADPAGGDYAGGAYDVVVIDAFKSANSIPYQLTTLETMRSCFDVLAPDGLLVMNVIASPQGAGSRFVAAEYATLATIFPQVNLYAVYELTQAEAVQNISIIATKAPRSQLDLTGALRAVSPELTSRQIDPASLPDAFVLTDDYAPADQLLRDI